MENQEFAEKLESIAQGLEKLAEDLEASKTAEESPKQDFGMGTVGDKPGNGADPLLTFIMG